jgi:hypothetical protein
MLCKDSLPCTLVVRAEAFTSLVMIYQSSANYRRAMPLSLYANISIKSANTHSNPSIGFR